MNDRRPERQYWYDEERPREELEPGAWERPEEGRWVRERELRRGGRRRGAFAGVSEPDPGHGWQQHFDEPARDAPARGGPPRTEAESRRYRYGRESYYGDPYREGEPGPPPVYGELYGRREADYADRRRPLYARGGAGRRVRAEQPSGHPGYRSAAEDPWEREGFPGSTPELRPGEGPRDRGPYFGTLPAGYRKSDERILDDVVETLSRHGWVDTRQMKVSVEGGEVTLEGTVPDRPMKHLTENLAAEITGVLDVDNRVRVLPGSEREERRSEAASD